MIERLKPWFMAFRPKTLSAALVPVVVGSAIVWSEQGNVVWWIVLCALGSALLIQIGTNLINDALDFERGADTEKRIGPQRATQSGLISSRTVMVAGSLSFFLAILLGVPLVIQGGWVILLIGVVSVLCGYAYTAGPYPLAYMGLGDLFVIVFFGLVAVGGIYYLQTGTYSDAALVGGLQTGLLSTILIAINNLRDVDQDREANKKTLAVRFGPQFVKGEIVFLVFLSFLSLAFWIFVEKEWLAGALPLITWPLARSIVQGVKKENPSEKHNEYLAKAAALQCLFSFQLALGLVLL